MLFFTSEIPEAHLYAEILRIQHLQYLLTSTLKMKIHEGGSVNNSAVTYNAPEASVFIIYIPRISYLYAGFCIRLIAPLYQRNHVWIFTVITNKKLSVRRQPSIHIFQVASLSDTVLYLAGDSCRI